MNIADRVIEHSFSHITDDTLEFALSSEPVIMKDYTKTSTLQVWEYEDGSKLIYDGSVFMSTIYQ